MPVFVKLAGLCAGVAMLWATSCFAQSADRVPPAAPSQSSAEEAKAARKAKFEEAKRRLEQSAEGPAGEVASNPGQEIFIAPAMVNMVVGETHAFCVFDIEGRNLTGSAEWSVNGLGVVDFSASPEPEVISKNLGRVKVRATVNEKTAEAEVNVIPPEQMTPGTHKWTSPQIPGYSTIKMVPAVPSAKGPDFYVTAQNEKGKVLLRAVLSDGRQLWMRYLSKASGPGSIPGKPASVIPH